MKRKDYIKWGDYFMGIALLSAQRSKDPITQVGCCAVDDKNRIIGIGYNGFPRGCSDDEFPWGKDGDELNKKYLFVVHAEGNLIVNNFNKLENSILYTTLFPCNECAKLIIQSGIKHIEYLNDKYHDENYCIASRKMFDASRISYHQYIPLVKEINIKFK